MKKLLLTILLSILPLTVSAQTISGLLYSNGIDNQNHATSSPVVGIITATSTTATSTFGNGINLTKGCFAINLTCIGSGSGSGTVNSGSFPQMAWYASDGTTVSGTSTDPLTVGSIIASSTKTSKLRAVNITGTATVSGGANFNGSTVTNGIWELNTSAGSIFTAGNGDIVANNIESDGTLGVYGGGSTALLTLESSIIGPIKATIGADSANGLVFDMTNLSSGNKAYFKGGNVGIGTSSPYNSLSVLGTTTASVFEATTTATSTFAGAISTSRIQTTATSTGSNGYNISAGCFSINNVCAGSGSGVSGGTAGMITAWVNSTTLTATNTPTAANYIATSSSATSTFQGSVRVATALGGQPIFIIGSTTPSDAILATSSMYMCDKCQIVQMSGTGAGYDQYYDTGHDGYGGEEHIDSQNSLSINLGLNNRFAAALQLGSSGPTHEVINLAQYDGHATAIATIIGSKKDILCGRYWNGADTEACASLKFVPDLNGNATIRWYSNDDAFGSGLGLPCADVTANTCVGNEMMRMTSTSTWALAFNATSTTATSTFSGGLSVGSLLYAAPSGNVGIGTSSPYNSLSVVGTTTASVFEATTTATSTFGGAVSATRIQTTATSTGSNGFNISAGCFSVSGTCVGSGSGVSGGTSGMLTSWTGATTLTATSGPTAAYYVATSTTATSTFAGAVGIGTTTPKASFYVKSTGNGEPIAAIEGSNTFNSDFLDIFSTSTNKTLTLSKTAARTGGLGSTLNLYDQQGITAVPAKIFVDVDENNPASAALYILPPSTATRIYMGDAAQAAFSLNMSHVTEIEGLGEADVNILGLSGSNNFLVGASSGAGVRANGYYGWEFQGNDTNNGKTLTPLEGWGEATFAIREGTLDSSGSNNINSVASIIYGRAGRSGDLLQFKNSAFTVQSEFNNLGFLGIASTSPKAFIAIEPISATTTNYFDIASSTNRSIFKVHANGNVSVGSTTPYANLSVQSNSNTGDAFVVATSSANAVVGYDNDGHMFTSGPTPTVTNGTDVGDDQGGTITTNAAVSSVTLAFSKAYQNTPYCNVTDDSLTISADISSISTTQVVFSLSAPITSGHLYYQCAYHK